MRGKTLQARTANKRFGIGDAVQHRDGDRAVGVVIDRMGLSRIVVSLEDKTTVVWYAGRVDAV